MHQAPVQKSYAPTLFFKHALPVLEGGRLQQMSAYLQHGQTNCFDHSIGVAWYSLRLAISLRIKCNHRALIRGALLHDYFLYDWHEKDFLHRMHGFTHPQTALANANMDFDLNGIERDIIQRHMFPLLPKPPKYRESLIVCLVDKFCSLNEIFRITPYRYLLKKIKKEERR